MSVKIVTVVGARPQFIKAAAVSRAMCDYDFSEILVHTGQHYDAAMSKNFFDELDIPKPAYNLEIGGAPHGAMTGRMLEGIERVLMDEKPDWILLYGDTNSTLAGALAAAKLHIPIVHVEAGMRSYNSSMPEEINRVLTDRVSDLLFCPTKTAVANLATEGMVEGVHHVGDVMYDASLFYRGRALENSNILQRLSIKEQSFVLVTCHRAENTDNRARLHAIAQALCELSREETIVFPIHPRTRKALDDEGLLPLLKDAVVTEPLPYLDMIRLEQSARMIMTDSGGVQKEAFFYGVPCLTLREETEWVETVQAGFNRLVPAVSAEIITAYRESAFRKPANVASPYGDGRAAFHICDILQSASSRIMKKPDTKIYAVEKAAWQPKIFATSPRRSEVLSLKPDWRCRKIVLRVHRNMPFEFIAGTLPPFLAYAGLEAEIILSDYDDALNSCTVKACSDCELVWLDFARYAGQLDESALLQWLEERLKSLRAVSNSPILIADDASMSATFNERLAALASSVSGIRIFPRWQLQTELGEKWTDSRMKNIAASTMSGDAVMAVAQLLGLVWLPGATAMPLKAIVLDLDNTLYAGVLGEDGIEGIELTPAHRAFQEKLLALKEQGLFLALLSRNEHGDVEKLFSARKEFPLQWSDFSAISVDWNDKSAGLQAIANQLRIDPDAMLIIDDNLGEIAEMASRYPAASFWHASDVQLGLRALDLFPRLLRWHRSDADRLRTRDLEASKERAGQLAQAADPAVYVRSLCITLDFYADPDDLRERLAELANKTNQFALSLARFGEAEVAQRLNDPRCATFAAGLADRLSDSGIVAAIFCRVEKQVLEVDEICISCRALGRHMEDAMIVTALQHARRKLKADKIAFIYNRGPRNGPALQWLEKISGTALPGGRGRCVIEWDRLCECLPDLPVAIKWRQRQEAA